MAGEGPRKSDAGETFREGVRAVTGVLGAFKDAIEQTLDDLTKQGDLAPDRAKEAARDAMRRAQEAMDGMRDRVDFVTRREFDALRAEVQELRARIDSHTTQGHTPSPGSGAPGDGSPGL